MSEFDFFGRKWYKMNNTNGGVHNKGVGYHEVEKDQISKHRRRKDVCDSIHEVRF